MLKEKHIQWGFKLLKVNFDFILFPKLIQLSVDGSLKVCFKLERVFVFNRDRERSFLLSDHLHIIYAERYFSVNEDERLEHY